jgi:hypothetical protein
MRRAQKRKKPASRPGGSGASHAKGNAKERIAASLKRGALARNDYKSVATVRLGA